VATANAITSGTAIAAGTATWARRKSGAGTAVIDASVGTANADIILGTTTISVGLVVPLTSDTLTHPA
jgi:septum formation inhibitor-activating ATPase MinD